MRIGINLYMLQPHVGGIGNYVLSLLRAWPKFEPEDQLVPFSFAENDELLRELPDEARRHEIRLESQEQILDHADAFDVYFCPFGALYPRPIRKPAVTTLVDIQERFFPGFFKPADIASRLHHYDGSLLMSDQVVTISEFSRQSMIRVLKMPPAKLDVIHLCTDDLPEQMKRPDLPANWDNAFMFFPANDWRHKNHDRLIDAIHLLKQRCVEVRCVLTGTQDTVYPSLAKKLDELNLHDTVRHLGRVSRPEMAWLFRNARMLVFPSLFEGFGIPLVEAMQCHLPIACSDIGSLPEVAGLAAVYFDPYEPGEMAEVIRHVWEDEKLRINLIAAGSKRSKLFTEQKLVEKHHAAFHKARGHYHPLKYPVNRLRERWRQAFPRQAIPARQLRRAAVMLHEHAATGINGYNGAPVG
ncbi:MAG: glycosyltransferase family 1 protein [Spartobacteria bacterium]|nr:glycosyltransferase family 1 protein [Spartobacteria bacterium]